MLNTRLKLNSKASIPASTSQNIRRNNLTERVDTPVSRFSRYYRHERLLMLPKYRQHSTYPQPNDAPMVNARRRHLSMNFFNTPLYPDVSHEKGLKMRRDTKFESVGFQGTSKNRRHLDVTPIDIDIMLNRWELKEKILFLMLFLDFYLLSYSCIIIPSHMKIARTETLDSLSHCIHIIIPTRKKSPSTIFYSRYKILRNFVNFFRKCAFQNFQFACFCMFFPNNPREGRKR